MRIQPIPPDTLGPELRHVHDEIAKLVGYKMVVIDMEHGAIGEEACDIIVAHCRAIGRAIPVRRTRTSDSHPCESALSHCSAIVYASRSALA